MATKTNSLRLTRGSFLTALVLSMTSAVGILQGCTGGGGNNTTDLAISLFGTWRTTTDNTLGKTLVLDQATSSFTTTAPDLSGTWNVFGLPGSTESQGFQLKPTGSSAGKDVLVLSVDNTTLVVKVGEETITYTKLLAATPSPSPTPAPTASPTPAPTPTPTPTPAPTPAPVAFTALPASITATHTVGVTACNQALGTITVTNTGTSSITVTIPAVAQLEFNKTSFTLAAGASTTVTVEFNCTQVPPFSRTITLTTTVGATTVTRTVSIQLNAG